MLPQASSYEDLCTRFRWSIPEHYNMGVDVCDRWVEQDPARVALIEVTRAGSVQEWTFAQIQRQANQLANWLESRGVERGDRVAVLLPQAPETAIAHVAVYRMGAIAVPLFTLFGVDALQFRLSDSGARVVITDRAGAGKLQAIRPALPNLQFVLSIDGRAPGAEEYYEQIGVMSDRYTPARTRAEDAALIIYTSGTTGPPKGALHAHRTLLGHLPGVEFSHDCFPQPGDRMWTPADWAWIGGLLDVLLPAWRHGVSVVAHRFEKFEPEAAFALMAEFHVRNTFLPPTALKMLRTVPDPGKRWNLALRSVASGGETLGAELLQWGRETFGLTINEFYGQTECNIVVASCSGLAPGRAGLIGRAVPGHEVAVIDDEGAVLPPNQPGQIAVRAPDPVMFLGYWGAEEATRRKYLGEWLLLGDNGVVDEEGYFRFIGRADDLINSAGYRIGPGEVEDCLLSHPAVQMAGVVGVPDALRNEIVKAFIVLKDGAASGPDLLSSIQDHVRTRLAAHEYPRQIEFVDSLPLTATGKVMRRELRARSQSSN